MITLNVQKTIKAMNNNLIKRIDFDILANIIDKGSSVLDLGCANGELIELLINSKNVSAQGVEISESGISECIKKGLSVYHGDIDEGLADFHDQSFDYVILSQTLQEVYNPALVMKEILRVGKKAIVSFPNFSYWKVRTNLFFKGSAFKNKYESYLWYDSPHINLITIKDFRAYCNNNNIEILMEIPIFIAENKIGYFTKAFPTVFAHEAIYLIHSA
jgi:methionine biosynthesis protein MetW